MDGKTNKAPPVLEQVKRVDPGLTARVMRFLFHSHLARVMLTLHRDLDHAHADKNMSKRQPRRYRRFYFILVLPSPQKRGAGWGRGAQQQQQKSAAATAAAARARGNEINTTATLNKFLTCEIAVF